MKKELFNKSQLNQIKGMFSGIKRVNPEGPAGKSLDILVRSMSKGQLAQIATAKIPFVSCTANLELRERK